MNSFFNKMIGIHEKLTRDQLARALHHAALPVYPEAFGSAVELFLAVA